MKLHFSHIRFPSPPQEERVRERRPPVSKSLSVSILATS
jgi:hypothetical protein